jgi:uncharacterized protein YcbK (DUF882 family)
MSKNAVARLAAEGTREEETGIAHRVARRALLGAAAGAVLAATVGSTAFAAPRGDRKLALYNPNTDERFDDVYWCDGRYVSSSLRRVDWLMRDYHQDKVVPIDPQLIDLLERIRRTLGTAQPVHILSGYRTAATNRLLRVEGWGPAAHSEHLLAKAADISIEGVSLAHLRQAALSLRAGGVGTYRRWQFVHVDVGPVRSW